MKSLNMKAVTRFSHLLVITVILAGCSQSAQKTGSTGSDSQKAGTQLIPVKVIKLKTDTIPVKLEYTANLLAFKEINFAPSAPGRIEKINVEVGSRIKKGQELVRMDQTQYHQALIQLQSARTNFLRMDTLYQLSTLSKQQYEGAKTQYDLAQSNVQFLKKNVHLLSPINGIVTGRYFENGEMFSGAPNTKAGKAAILTLMQINPLKAIINVSERYYPSIHQNMTADLKCDIFPGRSFSAKISRVYPTIDPVTRSFQVELLIENPDKHLRPGMFSRVFLNLGIKPAIVVPAISVIQQEGTNNRFVFIHHNGTVRKIRIEIGQRYNDKLEIISDQIHPGNELVIAGQTNLMEGSKVKLVK